MQIDQIKELIQLLDQSSVHEMELETSDFKLSLKKEAQQTVSAPIMQTQAFAPPAPAPQVNEQTEEPTQEKASYRTITSPMVGTFYSRPAPDREAFVNVGDRVESGQIVCILEAMKLFNDVEAEISGEIVEVLVADGDLVEFGQPLFSVK
ncbi:acetyl-CoA carboxylase biotin carboxyl carrier protein [Exiguobacterium sp. MER 193]|uniref:acetyl-CoA carboxylase biotin carboxyl carrier protein n=1 Tax=Exiguobacterium sp. MER 193 TaxID=2939564 RepID=UPI0020416CED|nr:acetyl-CoA carboxylase biotin carboxyl carrier protein [Exiguobacterium sp. MER 193]MCM3278960.1 acetyl-CoA carboxylase biotin carboxyl carrier protein [Exiguobacterium sp. MER 193]